MTVVVDASAVVAALVSDTAGAAVRRRRLTEADVLAAPHLLDLEVTSALRRLRHTIGERRATQALDDYRRLPLVRYPHEPLLPHIWALRGRLTAYDAAYVTLARALEASLLTLTEVSPQRPDASWRSRRCEPGRPDSAQHGRNEHRRAVSRGCAFRPESVTTG